MKLFHKKIAIIWFQGEHNIPKTIFKENLRNWRLLNPTWQVDLVDETGLRQACKAYSKECLKTFDSFDLLHMKIDFARYVLLYNDYTMYVDMDMYALRSLDSSDIITEFINSYESGKECDIVGLSTVNINQVEALLFTCLKSRHCINNAVMMASPRNKLIKELIDTIIKNNIYERKRSDLRSNYYKIQNITGPSFINKFFKNDQKGVYIFPHYIFEPTQPFGNSDIRDQTVAIHKFEMTWISESLKDIMACYFMSKPFLIALPFVFVFYLISKARKR